MKPYLIALLALGLLAVPAPAQDKPDLTNPKQKTSYAVGIKVASDLKAIGLDLDVKAVCAGIVDTMADKPALNDQEVTTAMTQLQKDVMGKREAIDKSEAEKNLQTGEKFLAENAKKEGVKTTASGLQYKVIKSGTGDSPKKTDTVKVHYHGTLLDGTVFDSSVQRGEPISFPLDGVIPGWTEGLQLMKVGDKWQLFIPAKLAYGERRAGPKIGPNSTLIFEVELLSIEK
jgi:FKBP-type peptidyl-prolyl cis-trans isomerase FklB